jgi:hypothetical protein
MDFSKKDLEFIDNITQDIRAIIKLPIFIFYPPYIIKQNKKLVIRYVLKKYIKNYNLYLEDYDKYCFMLNGAIYFQLLKTNLVIWVQYIFQCVLFLYLIKLIFGI